MLKWIEATGKTEDAAVQNALAQLGLDRDSVSVEVLERARSGFLGFGSTPATGRGRPLRARRAALPPEDAAMFWWISPARTP